MSPQAQSFSGPALRAGDVAKLLHVAPETVATWSRQGKLAYMRILGGHRRYEAGYIAELVARLGLQAEAESGRQ